MELHLPMSFWLNGALCGSELSRGSVHTHAGLNVALPVDGYANLGFQTALWFLKLFGAIIPSLQGG